MDQDGRAAEGSEQLETISWSERIQITTRTYFSIQHLQSAALFARQAALVETNWHATADNTLYSSLIAHSTAAVLSTTAFLEAVINELFMDSVENPEGHVKGLDAATIAQLADLWKLGIPRRAGYSILDKFQVALTQARKPLFEPGIRPYQDTNILVQLRNNLIHYEPQWVVETNTGAPEAVSTPQLVRKLDGKFALSPIPLSSLLKYLAHGAAQWAVVSSIAFADEFFTRMGLPIPYDHVRSELTTA